MRGRRAGPAEGRKKIVAPDLLADFVQCFDRSSHAGARPGGGCYTIFPCLVDRNFTYTKAFRGISDLEKH